jgi:hypothetical protein
MQDSLERGAAHVQCAIGRMDMLHTVLMVVAVVTDLH